MPNFYVSGYQPSRLDNIKSHYEPYLTGSGGGEAKSRPATAFSKVYDKLANISFGSGVATALGNVFAHPNQTGDNQDASQASSALILDQKLGKIIKAETKVVNSQKEFADLLDKWSLSINKPGCQIMLKEMSKLYALEASMDQVSLERLEKLKLSLHFINEREKKQTEMTGNRLKLLKQVKESEKKHGDKSSTATLLHEQIEENLVGLEIVNKQWVRAISNDLKDAIFEYVSSLQRNLSVLAESSNEFNRILCAIDWEADFVPSYSGHRKSSTAKAVDTKSSYGSEKENKVPKNEFPKNEFPKNEYPKNEYPKNEYPKNEYPKNEYPKNEYPKNEVPIAVDFKACVDCKRNMRMGKQTEPCTHKPQYDARPSSRTSDVSLYDGAHFTNNNQVSFQHSHWN